MAITVDNETHTADDYTAYLTYIPKNIENPKNGDYDEDIKDFIEN